jgi:glutathione S-transferase
MHTLVALVTLLALALYFTMSINVARARGKYGVAAPATTGHPDFERAYRIQANTLEGLIVFLPALWIFTVFSALDYVAAGLGLVWIVGRVLYMTGYSRAAEARGLGFGIQALASILLVLGGLGYVVWALVQQRF